MSATASPTRCYSIVIADIPDRDRFLATYAKVIPALVERFGGRYVLMATGAEFIEGGWCDNPSILITEWPDRAALDAFWNSAEYAEARKLREGLGRFQVSVIDDVSQINTVTI